MFSSFDSYMGYLAPMLVIGVFSSYDGYMGYLAPIDDGIWVIWARPCMTT